MLQRCKLGTKLGLVVALALVAVAAVAMVGYTTSQKVEIGSEAYQQSVEYEQLIADVLPPSQYLLEPYLTANRALRATSPAQVRELVDRLRLEKAQYYDSHAQWAERLAAAPDSGQQPALRDALLVQSFVPAETFWRIAIDDFIPAVESGQTARAGSLLDGPMAAAYAQHRTAVGGVVTLAQTQRSLHDASTSREHDRGLRLLAITVGAAMVGVVLVGFTVARAIRGPMRTLTAAAMATASEELPRLVALIDNARPGAPLPTIEPITMAAGDELAELAIAFNSVRQTAIELAAKQAATRRAIADLFVNLGRRNQALINRQLSFIDQLERSEEDPDTLEDLFRLDHLATRMRRNAESLLVLAGAEQARRWTESIDVANVVRSALSEIEEYTQVDIGEVERVDVRGAVVADVAHLLAELLENATAFSPPTARVVVSGRMLSEGYVISVVDEGIGMDPAALVEANDRIESVNRRQESPTRVLGLHVVGCLAARHAIRVRLVASQGRGVTARVLLPMSTIETRRATHTPIHAVALAAPDAFDDAMTRLDEPGPEPATFPPLDEGTAARPSLWEMYTHAPVAAEVPLTPAAVLPAALTPAAVLAPLPAPPAPAAPPTPAAVLPPTPAPPPPPARERPLHATSVDPRPAPIGGLTRRVRGAQLPDTGPVRADAEAPPRSADDVRALLTRFRAGVERGRDEALGRDPMSTNEGDQR